MGKEYFEGICHVLHFEEEKETGKTQEGQNRHYKQYSERGKPGERVLKPCSPVTCSVACRNGALLLSGSHCPHKMRGWATCPRKLFPALVPSRVQTSFIPTTLAIPATKELLVFL